MNNNEKTIEFLKENLERINYWLQFAEAKNGSLIVFDVAVLTILCSFKINGIFLLLYIIYCISLLLSLLTFAPNSKLISFFVYKKKNATDNMLFWKDVSKYSIDEYMKEIKKIFKLQKYKFSKIENQLINQIINNSKIANYKYAMFSISLILVIASIIFLILFFIIA